MMTCNKQPSLFQYKQWFDHDAAGKLPKVEDTLLGVEAEAPFPIVCPKLFRRRHKQAGGGVPTSPSLVLMRHLGRL